MRFIVASLPFLLLAVSSIDDFTPSNETCTTHTNWNFSSSDRSLFLIIEGRKELSEGIGRLAISIQSIFNRYKEQQNVSNIILVAFTPDGHIPYSQGPFYYGTEVEAGLRIIEANARNVTDVSCNTNVFKIIHDTFKAFPTFVQGASVIVASSSLPTDDSIDLALYVGQGYSPQTPIIDIIHLESKNCPVSTWADNHTNLQYTIRSTNGVLVRSEPLDLPGIIQHYADFRRKPIRLAVPKFTDCTASFKIQVDESLQEFFVFMSGNDSTVQIIDPSNSILHPNVTLEYAYLHMRKYIPKMTGTYTVSLNSQEKLCFPAVFGQGDSYVYFGFTQDPTNDWRSVFAARNSSNYPVFQFPMNSGNNSTLVKSSVVILSQGSNRTLSSNTSVVRRNNCTFSFITEGFLCGLEDEAISVVVKGLDSQNNSFTRYFTSFCRELPPITSTVPTSTAPMTTASSTLSPRTGTSSISQSTSTKLASETSTIIAVETTTKKSSCVSFKVSVITVVFAVVYANWGDEQM